MEFRRNAKLGLAGRRACPRRRAGLFVEEGRGRLQRLAGDRVPVVASLARGECGRAAFAQLLDRSSSAEADAGLLPAGEQRRICAARRPDRLGGAPADAAEMLGLSAVACALAGVVDQATARIGSAGLQNFGHVTEDVHVAKCHGRRKDQRH